MMLIKCTAVVPPVTVDTVSAMTSVDTDTSFDAVEVVAAASEVPPIDSVLHSPFSIKSDFDPNPDSNAWTWISNLILSFVQEDSDNSNHHLQKNICIKFQSSSKQNSMSDFAHLNSLKLDSVSLLNTPPHRRSSSTTPHFKISDCKCAQKNSKIMLITFWHAGATIIKKNKTTTRIIVSVCQKWQWIIQNPFAESRKTCQSIHPCTWFASSSCCRPLFCHCDVIVIIAHVPTKHHDTFTLLWSGS